MTDQNEAEYFINVDYLDSVGFTEYARAHFHTHVRRLFFEKMMDWRDETEFRWVIRTESKKNLSINFENSLVGIIFGENTKDADVEELIGMTWDLQIEYMGLKWRNCSPWYDLANPRYNRRPHIWENVK